MKKLTLASAIAAIGFSMLAGAASAEIKIGFSGVLSGPQALLGQDQIDGFMLGLEMRGGKFAGQPVTVLKEDDQTKAELGLQIIRKFIERDKVDALIGLGFTHVMLANAKQIGESGVVAISTQGGPTKMAGDGCLANIFYVTQPNAMSAEAMGKFMMSKGHRKAYVMTSNYQGGKDAIADFKRGYTVPVNEVYTTLNQSDFSAEIAQLQAANPDSIFVFYSGGMGINFIKQLSQAGLMGKLPLYTYATVDGTSLPALRSAAEGVYASTIWDASSNTPENKKFVAAFEAKYKRTPSFFSAFGYDAANLLDEALKKVNGKTSDKKAFVAAVKAAGKDFKSVRGNFRFGNNNMPIQDYHVYQVVKKGDGQEFKLAATPLASYQDPFAASCPLK
ncbi:MAG: ABC transporter substrate-binding protein [Pseudomonadota bacterium]